MPTPLPIACSLSVDQLDAQRESLLLGLADHAVQRSPLPSGMRLRFPATAERMRQIDDVVRHERECCPFLEFRVGLAVGTLTLDVTGPEGTANLLAELLEHSFAV
jgi:MerR family transcriptional regulator, copper efflux regulator